LIAALAQLGWENSERAAQLLGEELHQAPAVVAMAALSRQRFDELMPRLLQSIAASTTPSQTLERILP
jgi:[glutamine synthetase] adenylyltransferase / [glutamine synthetase]-adenylyl-L-tyrosine phosphorylase